MTILLLIIIYAVFAGAIVCICYGTYKDHKNYKLWDGLGLRKKRAKNYYMYAQYFIVTNVDYFTLRSDLITHALEYHIVVRAEDDPGVPNSLIFQKNPASWTANVTLVSQQGLSAIYQFRFSYTRSTNGKLVDREYMNAMQGLVEQTIMKYDPNVQQIQKEMDINRSVKVKVH